MIGEKELNEVSISVGNIYNYYGGLEVANIGCKYYWSIEDYNGNEWEEITKQLYDSLIEHNGGND
tara:strand:- start:68 stop:262 length:195 start_codon:yes stop_codon:yes gene_type:complete